MIGGYQIFPTIVEWCRKRHIKEPTTRRGWGYLGQTFVEWFDPVPRCQVELLPTSADLATCEVTARIFICDPLCSGQSHCYRVHSISNVGAHMVELFSTLDLFFPGTQKTFDFCKFMARVLDYECSDSVAFHARHVEYNLAKSMYREQFDKSLVDALNGEGFTEVTFSKEGLLRVSWENPASPQEQKLFDMFMSSL
jgi:hypothetical protein